jgi:hypothetical protein
VPEIVVDDPVYTTSMLRLTFDTHREGYCHPTRGSSCRERGAGGSIDAQASFMARILSDPTLGMEDLMVKDGVLGFSMTSGLTTLHRRLIGKQSWCGPVADDTIGMDVFTSACLAYHLGDRERGRRLLGLIDTEERAERLFLEAIRDRFGVPTFNWW